MKRIQLEPWTPYDKLSLASAVMRAGDQNWNAVARATRNIFEESTKFMIEEKRSPEWFSNKQCAAQYEALLKNIGPRRKKKSEKAGIEHTGDTPTDIIINGVRQECIEELKRSLASTQALYLKLHKEYEDIQAGKIDHKLEEMLEEYEAKEREKEIKMKLKFKLGEKNPEIMENSVNLNLKTEECDVKKVVEKESPISEPPKTNLTTSPLLTSLLQSPSPLTRPSLPSNTSPTISLLLNSSPSVPSSDSPTLTKLLEASTTVVASPLVTGSVSALPQVTTKQEPKLSSATTSPSVTPTKSLNIQVPVTTPQTNVTPSSVTTTSSPSTLLTPTSESTIISNVTSTIPSVSIAPITSTTTTNNIISTNVLPILPTVTSPVVNAESVSPSEKPVATSPSTSGDFEPVPEEIEVNSEVTADDTKTTEENKEILEIEEVENPSTPEIVLEDIVHNVIESEVVIGQETPTSKRKTAARRLHLELEETETDDEVMETVEQIIEKVEEAIIETVGEESTEIDLALNQSSETDNLSDNIETLELDSDAVELIVLGHNQGKVITIRHDTEINSEPVKSEASTEEVPPTLESFEGDIENLVEEEVRTSEEKVQDVEGVIDEHEEVEEIKLQEEVVEHEEVVVEKEIGEGVELNEISNTEIKEEKIDEGINEDIVKEVEQVQEVIKEEEFTEEKGKEIEIDKDPLKSSSDEITVENEILVLDDKQVVVKVENEIVKNTEKDEIILSEMKIDEENVTIEETKVEEAIVEEAPEEVVIAELVEEVVKAEKMQDRELELSIEEAPSNQKADIVVKDEISEEEQGEVTLVVENSDAAETKIVTPTKKEDKVDSDPKQEQNILLPVTSTIQKDTSLESKESLRTPAPEEQQSTTSSTIVSLMTPKIEKDIEQPKSVERKPSQEMEKRRGRKRHPLVGYADSKPNSPAPSSHSMEDDREYKAWKKSIMLVYNRLAAHKYASVFLKPITEAEATGYHNVVHRPMDLQTIKRNIETGVIRSTVEFQRDMILMAQNAMIYNKPDSLVFKMAEDMLADMMSQMEVMVQALGDGVPLWGDSDEKLLTRGRASKVQFDENTGQKRRSQTITEDSIIIKRGRPTLEESTKKRKAQQQLQEELVNKRKSEDNKKKIQSDDNSRKKTVEETTSKRKSHIDDGNIKKKGQAEESSGKKKSQTDENNSARKKAQTDDTKRKSQLDEGGTTSNKKSDDTPVTSKRKTQLSDEQQNKRKTDTPINKRKSQVVDDTPVNKRKNFQEDTPSNKRKSQQDETPASKRKRSSVLSEESRSFSSKRKRADAS